MAQRIIILLIFSFIFCVKTTISDAIDGEKRNTLYVSGSDLRNIKEKINSENIYKNIYIQWGEKNKKYFAFYDTKGNDALRGNKSIVYSVDENTHAIKKKQHYIEAIKIESLENTLSFQVKHYGTTQSLEEKNSLIRMIRRSDRDVFFRALSDNDLNVPMSIHLIFRIIQESNSATVIINGDPAGELIIAASEILFSDKVYKIKTIEIIKYNSILQNKNLFNNFAKNIDEILIRNGKIIEKINSNNKYELFYNYLKSNTYLFDSRSKYHILDSLIEAGYLCLIGSIVLLICLTVRKKLMG